MTIRAILFDAGNTLIFMDPRKILPILEKQGGTADEASYWKAEFRARKILSERIDEGAFGTENEIWTEYFQNFFKGCGVPEEKIEAAGREVRDVHREHHLWSWMAPETPAALDRLRDDGFRLGVISNADGRMEGLIEDAGIRDRFEFVMDSELEGVAKPETEIFLRGCRRLAMAPEHVLYVGDLYAVDVVGSRKAGMKAVLLDPMDELEYPVDRLPTVAALPDYMQRLST